LAPPKQAFYPKTQKIVNVFTLWFSRVSRKFAELGRDNVFVAMASDAPSDPGGAEVIRSVSQKESPSMKISVWPWL